MERRVVRRWDPWLSASPAARATVAVGIVGFVCLNLALIVGLFAGVRGALWFRDGHWLLLAFGSFLAGVGATWDTLLLAVGGLRRVLARGSIGPPVRPSELWRRRGFFSLGPWPLLLVLVTIYFLVGTSNISYISLELLETSPRWQDALFWELEGPLLVALTRGGVRMDLWQTVYNSGWNAEMLALFAVIVSSRCPARVAAFCVSFLLLFYVGRLIGLAAPVMGPAFFVPDHFTHLEGSLTGWMMEQVAATMQAGSSALATGATRLGGVAAMPSLHVGMVALAGWWLVRSLPWLAPLVVLWVLAVWTSTVLLGWHYLLDGLGGIATAALCIAGTRPILCWLGVDAGTTVRAAPVPVAAGR